MGDLSGRALAALILAIVAWMGFAVAFLLSDDPFFFLFLALVAGIVAIVLGVQARRDETVAVAAGATAAGAALLYGLTLAALLTAMVYAMGFLFFLILLVFLGVMTTPQSSSGCSCNCSNGGSSSSSSSGCCDGCCDGCADGCCSSACDCGCGECADCGCGGSGCGCIALGAVAAPIAVRTRPSWRDDLRHVWRHGLAHHPRTPAYDADVYRVGAARWCIGCFTTYPVFLLASALLVAAPPPWTLALAVGAPLALAQGVSSAGLATTRATKATVKASLGLGLALLVAGIHSAPWPPAAKLASYLALLALAWLSTLPRSRRLKKALQADAGVDPTTAAR